MKRKTTVDLSDSPFMFVLTDGANNPIPKSLYEIRVNFLNFTKETGEEFNSLKFSELKTESCDISQFNKYGELFSIIEYQKFECIPPNKYNISIFGNNGDAEAKSHMNIYVNMCNNVTMNNGCKTKEEIKPLLENTYLHMGYIDYEINHYDYDNPVKPYLRIETFPINWDLHTRYYYGINSVNYISDYGFIFDKSKVFNYYSSSKIDQTVQIRHGSLLYPGLSIGTVTLYKESSVHEYKRLYPKIQTLLARIGGSIQAILLIGKAICYIITKNLFLIEMINLNFSRDFNKYEDSSKLTDKKMLPRKTFNNSKLILKTEVVNKMNVIR